MYSWDDIGSVYDEMGSAYDDPDLLFDTSYSGGLSQEALRNFANSAQRFDPTKEFKQITDPGFSSIRQPHTDRAFREYDEWLNTGKFYRDQEANADTVLDDYSARRDNFSKYLTNHYRDVFGVEPEDKKDYDRTVSLLDNHYSSNPDIDASTWNRIKKGYSKINDEYQRAFESKQVTTDIRSDFDERNLAVDPVFKRAFDNRAKTNKATKGKYTGAHSPEELNEFLSKWNLGTSLTGDPDEPYSSVTHYKLPHKVESKSPIEAMMGEAEFSSLMSEHRRGEWLPGNGFEIPPSRNGKIAGVSTRLRNKERGRLLLKKARDAGITHFLDDDGNKIAVDDSYFEFEDYDEDDDVKLELLDNYFNAQNEHRAALDEFFANRSSMTPDEQEKAIEKNQLLLSVLQERAVALEAAGMIDEAANRSESLDELGRLGAWWKTGTLQAEASELAKSLFVTGGSLDASGWQKLVGIVEQQDELERYKQQKGYSPLAEIQKMSKAEGDEGWLDAIGKWLGNPQAFFQTGIESLSALLPAYLDTAPEVIGSGSALGALSGSVVPGAGTLAGGTTGAVWGARVNYGVASAMLEATSKIVEGLRELGVDPYNPKQYAAAWANEEIKNDLRETAFKKGVPLLIFDTLSAGIAGKVAPIVSKPSVLKKLPSELPGGKKYFKGLSDKASDELMELKKLQRSKKLGDDGLERMKELDNLRVQSKGFSIKPTESEFGRAIRKADKNVHRYTRRDVAKNAALEMGAQMAFGGLGEATGQLWSREPGDPIDKHAILGEVFGEFGGIGTVTSAFELAANKSDFTKKPENKRMVGSGFEVTNQEEVVLEEGNEYAREGTLYNINRAGWSHSAFEPKTATDATAYIAETAGVPIKIPNPDPAKKEEIVNPQLQAMNDYIGGVMNLANQSEEGGNIRIVIDNRTPENKDGVGYVERDPETNTFYVYLNPDAANRNNDNVFGAAIHEYPHILGQLYGDRQVVQWYDRLTNTQKKQALAHYVFKDERAHADFTNPQALSGLDMRKLEQAEATMSKEEKAQEWFAFEVARILLGQINETSLNKAGKLKTGKVKGKAKDAEGKEIDIEEDFYTSLPAGEYNNILGLLDQHIFQPYQKYIGSGVRRQAPQTFGRGIENNAAGVYEAPPGLPGGQKPMISSETSLRPEKMGDDEMYATILKHMQWQVTPDKQITWTGPDKFEEKPFYETDMGRLTDQRNKLLGSEQEKSRLERLAGILPGESLKIRVDEKGDLAYDERGKPYVAEGTDTRSKEEVEEFVDEELQRQAKRDSDEPYQPAGRIREVKFTPVSSDIKTRRENLEAQEESGYDASRDFSIEKDDIKKRLLESTEMGEYLKEEGLQDESVKSITKKMDALYEASKKKGMTPDQIMATPDMKKLVEQRNKLKPIEKDYDAAAQRILDRKVKEATVQPGMVGGDRTLSKEAVAQRAITQIENRRKEFKQKHEGKAPEEKLQELYKLIKSDDKEFMAQTQDIVDKLQEEKGRVTQEEFLAELARSYGLDDMANSFVEARSELSDRSNLQDIEQAYNFAEDSIESVVEKLDLLETDTKEKILDTEQEIDVAKGEFKRGERLTKDESGKLADNIGDAEGTRMVNMVKSAVKKAGTDPNKLSEFIVIEKPENKQAFLSGIKKLTDEFGIDAIKYLDKKVKINLGDIEREGALNQALKDAQKILYKGAISQIKTKAGAPGKVSGLQKKQADLQKRLKKIQDIRSTVGVGSLAQNVDWRKQEVVGKTLYNATIKDGKTERPLVLGDLTKQSSINILLNGKEKNISNPQIRLKRLITEEMSPENMAKWGEKIPNSNQTYGDYAMTLMYAAASMREGTFTPTQYGTEETPYFEADVGSNIVGAVASRIQALRNNLNQKKEEPASKGSMTQAEKDELAVQDKFISMNRYESAFDAQNIKAVAAREAAVKDLTNERDSIIRLAKEAGGGKKQVLGLQLIVDELSKKKDLVESDQKHLQEMKDFLKASGKQRPKNVKHIQDKETGRYTLTEDKKFIGPVKTTPATLEEFLGSKGLSLDNIKAEKDKDTPLPPYITAEDRIMVNLAATQMAYDMFARDTSKVGSRRFFDRFKNDYELSLESELQRNIDYFKQVLATNKAPEKIATPGQILIENDIFRIGSQVRKANQTFTFSNKMADPEMLDSVSNVVDMPSDALGTIELKPEERKRIEELLASSQRVKDRYDHYMFSFEDSDILNAQPQVDDLGDRIEYTHWLKNLAERRWEQGPPTWDKPFGNYNEGERPNYGDFRRPKSNKDPLYVDEAFGGSGTTPEGDKIFTASSALERGLPSNMTEKEYEDMQARIAAGKPNKKDKLLLKSMRDQERIKAMQELNSNRISGGSLSGKLARELNDDLAQIRRKLTLPEEIERELNYDEILDKPVNTAQAFMEAVITAQQGIPQEMLELRYEKDGRRFVERDIKKIFADKELKQLWLNQKSYLADFDFNYDNLEAGTDPVVRSLNTIEVNDLVKNALEAESAKRDKIQKGGHTYTLPKKELDAALNRAGLLNLTKQREALEKVSKAGGKIVYSESLSEYRGDRRPRYRKIQDVQQLLAADPGDSFMLYKSKDGKAEPTMHEVRILKFDKNKLKKEGFVDNFKVAERYNNLTKFLEDEGIVKIHKEITENPVSYVSSYGVEAKSEIQRQVQKLQRMYDADKAVLDSEIEGNAGVARQKISDAIAALDDKIELAREFVASKGKKGKFEFDDVKNVGGYLQSKHKGAWGSVDQNGNLKKLDRDAQIALDGRFSEVAIKDQERFQDALNTPMAAITNMSSFIVTPRKLGQFLADNGVNSVNMLASSHSKWKAETRGGIELLKFLPGVLDEMLDSLATVNAKKRERVGALLEAYKGRPEEKTLEQYLDRLNEREQGLKDLPVSKRVLLDHIAINMENSSRKAEKPSFLSENDFKAAQSLHEKDKKIFSVAVAQPEAPALSPRIVNLGTYEYEAENQYGKKEKVKAMMRVLMTPMSVDKDGQPVKVTQEEYNKMKTDSRTEGVDAVADDFTVISKSKNINIEPVGSRWPVNASNKDEKLDAYVYDLKFLTSEAEVSGAYMELVRSTYDRLGATQKRMMDEFYAGIEDLRHNAFDPKTGKRLEGARELADNYEEKMDFALAQEDEILQLFESGGEYKMNIPRDIRTKKVQYPGEKRGIDLQQSKLRTLARLVYEAGGIQQVTAEDVRLAGIQAERDAAEYTKANDQANVTAEDFDDQETQQGVAGDTASEFGVSNEELMQEMQEFDQASNNIWGMDIGEGSKLNGFSSGFNYGGRSQGFLGRLAKAAGIASTLLGQKIRNGEDPHKENFFNARIPKTVETPLEGLESFEWAPYRQFVEQFAALEDSHEPIMKALGVDPTSDEGEKMNVYSEAYATMGRTGAMMDTVNREFIDPITDAMHKTGVDKRKLGLYLIALSTPQANKAIANNRKELGLDPLLHNGKQAGSGMTDADAAEMKRSLETDEKLMRFINHKDNPLDKIFQMHEKTLDYYVESQAIDREQFNKLKKAATGSDGKFRRLPLRGMHWLESDQWEQDRKIADLLGGESRAQGKGFDQPRKDGIFQGAGGRVYNSYADPEAMLEHTVQQHTEAVMRSQRAKPALKLYDIHQKLLDLKEKNPGSYAGRLYDRLFEKATEEIKYEYKIVEDANGEQVGKIQEVVVPVEMADSKRIFFARQAGQPVMMKFAKTDEGAALANAMKNLSHEKMNDVLEAISWTTQTMGKVVTKWNPEFWLRNPIRDTSAVWFNLGDSAEGKKVRSKVLNPLKSARQAKAIAKYERYVHQKGKLPPGLEAKVTPSSVDRERVAKDPLYAYHVMKELGGKTAFYLFKSVDKVQKEIDKKVAKGSKGSKWTAVPRAINEVVENINTAMENMYRARAFAEFIANGQSVERAIREARNVTVDFNKRGVNGRQLGAFIMFANPAIQGTKRAYQALKRRSPKERAQVGFQIFTAAFAWNIIARALSERDEDEEDDGSTYYDDRGNQKNFTSIAIPMDMFHEDSKGRHIDLPVDFAWSPVVGLASLLAKQVYHRGNDKYEPNLVQDIIDYVEISAKGIAPVPNGLNPFPAVQPLFDVAYNEKDFGGSPVYNEGTFYAPAKSPEQMSTKNTGQGFKDLSKFLNRLGGGDKYKPGNWAHLVGSALGMEVDSNIDLKDPTFQMGPVTSGAVLQYLSEQYLGGLGEMASDLTHHIFYGAKNDKKIPLVNALYKASTSDWPTVGRYYNLQEKSRQVERTDREWRETNQIDALTQYHKDHPEAKKLTQIVGSAKKNLDAIRRMTSKVENNNNLSEEQKMQRLEAIEKKRINTMRQALVKAHKSGIAI